MSGFRKRYWLKLGFALIAISLAVLTLITREWIELIFGVDPDNGSGALELILVASFVVVAVFSGAAAMTERRHVHLAI